MTVGTRVVVAAAGLLVALWLSIPDHLAGHVREFPGADGNPVSFPARDVTVVVKMEPLGPTWRVQTRSDGSFDVWVPAGLYKVTPWLDDYPWGRVISGSPVQLVLPGTTLPSDFLLDSHLL